VRVTNAFIKASIAEHRARQSRDAVAVAITDRRVLRHLLRSVGGNADAEQAVKRWMKTATRRTRRALGWRWWRLS
jgi:hypothetical protein